jgi:hypothetical protein|tara:strand:+ start:324 stop:557 length:234 start_codon:yes stop_codon:yes gene_type:complete
MRANLKDDPVDRPKHYTTTKFEVIDVLEEFFPQDPLLWQCGKYLMRCKHKGNPIQDLKKMIWYAQRQIKSYEDKGVE